MFLYFNAHQLAGKDAMGVSTARLAYSDANIYMAYNERDQITPVTVSYPLPLSRFLVGFSIIRAVKWARLQ